MKKVFTVTMILFLLGLAACGAPAPAQPGVETIVAGTLAAMTSAAPPVETPVAQSGAVVSTNFVNFVIPVGLGTTANVESMAAVTVEEGPMMGATPAHTKFTITDYPLQGKFFEAHILVYPAPEYEAMNEAAARELQKLRAILASPSAPLTKDMMPYITAFNAGMVFASKMQVIPFQSGSGVRLLTEYSQYAATVNNTDMFYEFQGLTSDGRYYIIAVLPVNAPFLPADPNPQAVVPADGVPLTGLDPDEAYYTAITDRINQAAPGVFTPTLDQLDALIQSIVIQ